MRKRIEMSSFSELLKPSRKSNSRVQIVEREFSIVNDLRGMDIAFDYEPEETDAFRPFVYLICKERGKIISIEKHSRLREAQENLKNMRRELESRRAEITAIDWTRFIAKIEVKEKK